MRISKIWTNSPEIKYVCNLSLLKVLGLLHNANMANAFMFVSEHGGRAKKSPRSVDLTIMFIGAIGNSFLGGVFVLPIGNLTLTITHVV